MIKQPHETDDATFRLAQTDEGEAPVRRPGGGRQRLILAALDAIISIRGRRRPTPDEVRRYVWTDNTRRMGIRFTERLRDAWRRRWVRFHPANDEQETG